MAPMAASQKSEAIAPSDDMHLLLGLPPAAWASVVLILGLLFTGVAAYREWHGARQHTHAIRSALADTSVTRLQEPLEKAAANLRALQTVFLSNDDIDQASFEQYNDNLRTAKSPGQVITGFARRGTRESDGDSYVYEFLTPYRGNEVLLGFDIARQPGNLQALYRARDSDQPVISSPFALLQFPLGSPDSTGLVVRLPVYSDGPLPTTVTERRQREIGSLAISLRLRSLVQQALQGPILDAFQVRVSDVTDGPAPPFYDSGTPAADSTDTPYTRALDFGGRRWSVELRPRPVSARNNHLPLIVATGLAISALLSLLLWSLATTRRRAVTLARKLTTRYQEIESRFRTLNELLPALVLLADAQEGQVLYANQAARLRLGETQDAVATLSSLFADPLLRLRAGGLASAGSDWSNVEAVLITPSGEQFWANTSIAHVEMEGRDHLLMVATDISEQRQLTEMLSYQASHDALTELCNRREFELRLEKALAERRAGGASCALLYIDLDQFKLINDISGHMAGDQLLAQLALAMRQQMRTGDVLARLGGDEFGLIAFSVDAEGARLLGERLRECIEGLMFVWEGRTYTISASVGVVVVDHGEPTLKDLLAWADTACYQAKENGRNRVHVYRQDNETTRRQSEMEWANRLRWEVEEDRLLLDYQEIVPLGGEQNDAPRIELLLRLRDEHGGLILPGTFLPAAERYSLMPTIDRWVIQTALAHFAHLHPAGDQVGICAINLSGASIEDSGLADFILDLISRYSVPPQKLCFEITETVAVRNLLKVVNVIERLGEAGCLIALDDFGAGMSSFGYLKNLPVDIIKIDGSFIRDLESDSMSRTIVNAIAQIGHQRGLKVVAEWVSSEALARTLGTLGVDYGQGFALHRPERVSFQRENR